MMKETTDLKDRAEYIDAQELARRFSVSTRTVARWVENGAPAKNLAAGTGSKRRALRFSVSAVAEWLDACEQASNR